MTPVIYTLSDPRTGAVRYVGQTGQDPKQRLREHRRCAKRGARQHVYCWWRSIGQDPLFEIVEESTDINDAERFWIVQFRALGFDLVNHTEGGEGQKGCKWSDEAKVRQSRAQGGRAVFDQLGNRYETTEEAARKTGAASENIRAVLQRKKLSAKGFTFWYEGEAPRRLPTPEELSQSNSRSKKSKPFKDQTGRVFRSLSEAAKALDLHVPNIVGVLKGRNAHSGGHRFEYVR